MTKDEALTLALEALENGMKFVWTDPEREAGFVAIDAIKEALAQPERSWVGLTREEMVEAVRPLCSVDDMAKWLVEVSEDEYQAIEATLKEKNT